jgi:hypothetical protein
MELSIDHRISLALASAQLRQQEFHAPKVYPPLPPSVHPDYPSAELGMKLSVGFEMLYADRARYGQTAEGEEEEALQNRPPLQDDPGWRAFKQSLESRGYFKVSNSVFESRRIALHFLFGLARSESDDIASGNRRATKSKS